MDAFAFAGSWLCPERTVCPITPELSPALVHGGYMEEDFHKCTLVIRLCRWCRMFLSYLAPRLSPQ